MIYYKCKCGSREAWSSMGVAECVTCANCGSTLAQGPNSHLEPIPHDWKMRFTNTLEGPKPVGEVCLRCMEERDPQARDTDSDFPKKVQALLENNDLDSIVNRIREIFNSSFLDYEEKYDKIFDIHHKMLVPLNTDFTWTDFDTTYKEDVIVYFNALMAWYNSRKVS